MTRSFPRIPDFSPDATRLFEENRRERERERDLSAVAEPRSDDPGPEEAEQLTLLEEDERGGWKARDLGPFLRGETTRPEPTVGARRSDNLPLLYPGKEHSVAGPTEAGKSWFALACVAAELDAGRPVLYVHFEDADERDTVERLLALGVTADALLDRFRFIGPEAPVNREWLDDLLDPVPSLTVLDGVNEALGLHSLKDDAAGIAEFRRRLVKPCTRVGAATLACDHVVKNPEARAADRGPGGSGHRINGLTGVQFLLDNAEPFGRQLRGRSHLYVTKDRPAFLRQHGRAIASLPGKTYMGELVVDDTQSKVPDLTLRLYAPRDDGGAEREVIDPVAALGDDVLVALAEHGGRVDSVRDFRALLREADVQIKNTVLQDVIADLKLAGRLEETYGKRNAKGYRVTTGSRPPTSAPVPTTGSASGSP